MSLWHALLQADQEQRYWHEKACEYVKYDGGQKVFLALLSSGAVAGWVFWLEVPLLWKALSGGATVISIVMPIMNWSQKIISMTELHGQWLQLMHQYESMWRDQDHLEMDAVRSRLDDAKRREAELSAKAVPLPGKDQKLGKKTYESVISDRTQE